MALIDDVRGVCTRLAAAGWRDVFRAHGLDIEHRDLAGELSRPLPHLNRDLPEVADLSPTATRGIEPGSLAESLLYHMLASPDVVPAGLAPSAYPTLVELDTIENYVFAAARRTLQDCVRDCQDPVVAVLAYQYRAGFRTSHGFHADAVFSRTGIARVGVRPPRYDATRRSFWTGAGRDSATFCSMPARYGAFIAKRGSSGSGAVLRVGDIDRAHTFVFPYHKLFPGDECLIGLTIGITFREWHASEKLRRIHTAGGIQPTRGFDVNAPPFVRGSDELVTLRRAGATALLVPISHESVVRVAKQRNSISRKQEVVGFVVPKADADNRYSTSLQLATDEKGRPAPEYVNIRMRIGRGRRLEDLNELRDKPFAKILKSGGYEAAHYLDDTCDGAVAVTVTGLPSLKTYAAYSLVSAPDLMPRVDQIDIQRWAESNLRRVGDHFNQGGPSPLCDGRNTGFTWINGRQHRGRMPNPDVRSPVDPAAPAFDRSDVANLTITAVLGRLPSPSDRRTFPRPNRTATFLPDAASDVFAPGWDVSQYGDNDGEFYQNYGLGSPFPEDAKLCAALNSYWPAAAPDAARTFPEMGIPTAMPLLDDELGFHPEDPRVKRREVKSIRGWDGEYGPYFLRDGKTVNFASIDRSDYVQNAARGLVRPGALAELDTREILHRMDALRFCIQNMRPWNDTVASTSLWLVSARAVENWKARPDRARPSLVGRGYVFIFAARSGDSKPTRDPRRRTWRVKPVILCQMSDAVLCWRVDSGDVHEIARPPFEGVLAEFPPGVGIHHR